MVKFSYPQNKKFSVIMFLIIWDIQKHCLRCHQKFLLPVFFQTCIFTFSGGFIYLKTGPVLPSHFHGSEWMCCSEQQEEATPLSASLHGWPLLRHPHSGAINHTSSAGPSLLGHESPLRKTEQGHIFMETEMRWYAKAH